MYSIHLSLPHTTRTGNKHVAIAIRVVRIDLNYGISGDRENEEERQRLGYHGEHKHEDVTNRVDPKVHSFASAASFPS